MIWTNLRSQSILMLNKMTSNKKRLEFKPKFYLALISVTLLVCVTVFHLSNIAIKPKISSPPVLQAISSERSQCEPKKNIFFLKTHKTAGTTVQNMLLRYADSHNLTVALPILSDSHYFPLDKPFNRNLVKESPWGHQGFNILCHHMVYNQKEVEAVMPPDTIFFTIVRDPVSLFESHYEYSNWRETLKLTLDQFGYVTKKKKGRKYAQIKRGKYQNLLLKDFGISMSEEDSRFRSKIFSTIAELDHRFNFVMLTEYFDESIVLLNRILCWNVEDLVSFTNNARSDKYRSKISPQTAERLRIWNKGDEILYKYFRRKFEANLKEAWKSFNVTAKVEELRLKRKEMKEFCVEATASPKDLKEYKFWSEKIVGYKLKQHTSTCEDLVKPERQLTNELRIKQLSRLLPKNIASEFLSKLPKNKLGEKSFVKRDLEMVNLIFLANRSAKVN